jgi:hypothetical protein
MAVIKRRQQQRLGRNSTELSSVAVRTRRVSRTKVPIDTKVPIRPTEEAGKEQCCATSKQHQSLTSLPNKNNE